jgi:hypothetical protein
MAAHASTRTTQLYDRREDRVTLDEVVKINIRGRDRRREISRTDSIASRPAFKAQSHGRPSQTRVARVSTDLTEMLWEAMSSAIGHRRPRLQLWRPSHCERFNRRP